jgi:hypothetical protein
MTLLTPRRILGLAAATMVVVGVAGASTGAILTTSQAASAAPTATGSAPASPAAGGHQGKGKGGLAAIAGRVRHALIEVTAQQTGLSVDQVKADLKAGKSIDEIAGGKHADVENAALALLKQKLDAAVTAGKITQDKETALLAKAKTLLEKVMAKHFTGQGGGGGRAGHTAPASPSPTP